MIARCGVRQRRGVGSFPKLMFLTSVLALLSCRPPAPPLTHDDEAANERRTIEGRLADWTRRTATGQIDSIADIFTTDACEADPQPITCHWATGDRRALAACGGDGSMDR
jgi:hypothetical protein